MDLGAWLRSLGLEKHWTVSLALVGALGMTAAVAADKQYSKCCIPCRKLLRR
jgi:hypothetical protein